MRLGFSGSLTVLMSLLFAGLAGAQIEELFFLDPDGYPQPIQEEEDILFFLRTAKETGSKALDQGITKARRLDLEQDGIKTRAVFHHIQRSDRKVKQLDDGRVRGYLRDSYTSQIAAYEIGRMLEILNIPPTVRRRSEGINGSAQLWIEKAMTEIERQEKGIEPPDQTLWNQLYADMRVFDNLINNIDRNQGNMLVDSQGHLWLIDHTRSFGQDKTIPYPAMITRCSNRLYEELKALDEEQVQKRMKSQKLLAPGEIKALFRRRTELLEKIDDRIRERGREVVLFDYGDLEPGIEVAEEVE